MLGEISTEMSLKVDAIVYNPIKSLVDMEGQQSYGKMKSAILLAQSKTDINESNVKNHSTKIRSHFNLSERTRV